MRSTSTRRARTVRSLDCFVSVPSGDGAPMESLPVQFGDELVQYAIGASSCAVPGLPAGLDALWRAHGRLPWAGPRRAGAAGRPRRRHDAEGACLVPRDARPRDDDARGRGDVRAERRAAGRGRPAAPARPRRGAGARPRRGRGNRLLRLDRRIAARADRRARGVGHRPRPRVLRGGLVGARRVSRSPGGTCARAPASRASRRRWRASTPPAAPTRCSRRSSTRRRSTATPRTSPSSTARGTRAC